MSTFCTSCGQQLESGIRFCTACGRPTDAPTTAPPPDAVSAPTPDAEPTPRDGTVPPRPGGPPPRPTTPPPVVAPPPAATTAERSRRPWLLPAIAALVVVGLVGTAVVVLGGRGGDGTPTAAGPDGTDGTTAGGEVVDFGTIDPADEEPSAYVTTEEWGEVPADRITVVLAAGRGPADAEALAANIGGEVIGHLEFINLFQIGIVPDGEAGLRAALAAAAAFDGVAVEDGVPLAFPEERDVLDVEVAGVRISPLAEDPVYGGDSGRGYQLTGVERAWEYVRGSGLPLGEVRVGIVDSGVWTGNGEFDGESRFDNVGGAGVRTDPQDGHAEGSHGTAVMNVIGADPDNGGVAGVASVLGDKLGLSSVSGRSGVANRLAQVQQAVEGDPPAVPGATIVNMSFGCTDCSLASVATSKRFFERMAREHPEVLFVASAGNDSRAIDGSRRWPSGLSLPNMITVGNIRNDGTTKDSATNFGSEGFEVTLAAPGADAVRGVTADGEIVGVDGYGGTSLAAPQVAAAAAILRSLDPTLDAGQIKTILQETASPGATFEDHSVPTDPRLGAGLMSVDEAVRKVINDRRLREDPNAQVLEPEDLLNLAVVDAVAISGEDEGEWTVVASVKGCYAGCTDVTISVSGDHALSGSTTQSLSAPGDVSWGVFVQDPVSTIVVRRTDNKAGSRILLESIDLDGLWAGSLVITSVDAPEDSCLAGTETPSDPVPLQLELVTDPGGGGVATVTTDESYRSALTWSGNTVHFTVTAEGGSLAFSGTAVTGSDGGGTITGSFSGSLLDARVGGTWSGTRGG